MANTQKLIIVEEKEKHHRRHPRGMNFGRMSRHTPLPIHIDATLVYTGYFLLSPPAAGTTATHVFSANGLYDPDITGTGHQPKGFDQLMLMYDHYVVKSARCEAHFWGLDSTSCPVVMGVSLQSSDTVPFTSLNNWNEEGQTKFDVLPVINTRETRTIVSDIDVGKFLGVPNVYDDRDLAGSNAANPSEGASFHIFAGGANGSTNTAGVACYVKITYRARFVEPRALVAS